MGSTVMMYVLPMILGQTYDLGKERPGIPIFLEADMANARTLGQYFTDYEYRMVENSDDVKSVLDISGKLSIKIKGGMVDVNGEGSYLKDTASKTDGLEILIKLHYETVTKTIPSTVTPREDWQQFPPDFLGTHFCRSITYGGDLIASVRVSASSSYDMQRIKGAINGAIKAKGFSGEIKARLDMLKQSAQDSSSMEIDYYATVPLEGVSYDVDGLMKLVHTFPDQVKKVNDGLGNPLRMELYPLNALNSGYAPYFENKTLTGLLSDFEDQFDDLRAARKAVGTWITGLPPVMDSAAEQKIREYVDTVNSIYATYLKTIAELDVAKGAPTTPIYTAIDEYKNEEYIMYEKYVRRFHKLQRDIYAEFPDLKPRIGGALFTHWGRYDCPSDGSELVISGVSATSENGGDGASSNYICSPLDPDLQNATTYFPNYDPEEEESKYREADIGPLRYRGKLIKQFENMRGNSIACARCRTTYRSTVLMKPGDKKCPTGYTVEYQGVLMCPGASSVPKGSYICVDSHMQRPSGDPTFGDEFASHLATVEEVTVKCGSLPCTPYKEKEPIPCVVCTI